MDTGPPFTSTLRSNVSVLAKDGPSMAARTADLTYSGPRNLIPRQRPHTSFPWGASRRQVRRQHRRETKRERKWKPTGQPREGDLPLRPGTAYWSKLDPFTGRQSAPAIGFRLRRLEPMGDIYFPEMQAIPKVVTPAMEAILQNVAKNVHQQRLATIHAKPVHLLEHQLGDLLPRKVDMENKTRRRTHRWHKSMEGTERMPAGPRKQKPQVRSLAQAKRTKREQKEFEDARRRKLASWAAKYAKAAEADAKLKRETAMVKRLLGM